MPLNQVQINHMNQTVRQGMDGMVRSWDLPNTLVNGLAAVSGTTSWSPLTGPRAPGVRAATGRALLPDRFSLLA